MLKLLCCSACQCWHAKGRWLFAVKERWLCAACSWVTRMPPSVGDTLFLPVNIHSCYPFDIEWLLIRLIQSDVSTPALSSSLPSLFVCYEVVGLLVTESHQSNIYVCLLKLSTGLFRRSEEKSNSCELRYYFVNYVTNSSSSTVNSTTVA